MLNYGPLMTDNSSSFRFSAEVMMLALAASIFWDGCAGGSSSVAERFQLHRTFVRQIDSISVWTVDGNAVRTQLDIEFTNFGHAYSSACIPRNEIWLDRERVEDEQDFFVEDALREYRLMASGMSADDAIDVAGKEQQEARTRARDRERLLSSGGMLDTAKVHGELWRGLISGVRIWIVDGRLVRSVFDVNFTEGGHDLVYAYVPRNEVWIDNDLFEDERPFVLLHELHERGLMSRGMSYDEAHTESSALELQCRKEPQKLREALRREGYQ